MLPGFVVLFLFVQRKSQRDTSIDVIGIQRQRMAIASHGVIQPIEPQMFVAPLLMRELFGGYGGLVANSDLSR